MDVQAVKQRFGIIGNTPLLNRALEVAIQVAPTDISVLVTGESGTGKEIIPQVIHHLSARKHGNYIAVNCGAIPEGTIDSELFGHEKGAFTGASGSRKGYFEEADGGTIFLDEVAELPMQTQVRLLRVLETGEFIRVGSSKVIKTDVRVVAATNENMHQAIRKGKFREDLLYRLSTVPITLPPLRDRKEDVYLLFRKFASDFAEKYRMPTIRLTDDAVAVLEKYAWPGNIRQLKNSVEQISVIEKERTISGERLAQYLPEINNGVPVLLGKEQGGSGSEDTFSDRELMYKFLFDMKRDLNELKKLVVELLNNEGNVDLTGSQRDVLSRVYTDITHDESRRLLESGTYSSSTPSYEEEELPSIVDSDYHEHIEVEESLSLEEREKELIEKALEKHHGKRKYAARELGISERTLYRKIKEYELKK